MSLMLKKKPLSKNLCLSFTGKEPIFNSITLYNNFPIGLMIISKLDPISNRADVDEFNSREDIDEQENDIKLKFINEHARELFELKENDTYFRIKEQLMKFKLNDNNENAENKIDNLYALIFHKEKNDFYGSFKNKNMIVWVKYNIINDEIYLCADYFTDERKFIQNELFQSIKFQYIATLFHELYNPINAILVMMEQNKGDDDSKSNMDSYTSDIDGSHFSLITENEFDKINCNFNENITNDNNNKDANIKNEIPGNETINLLKKYEKCKRTEALYRNYYISMKEKENDVRFLVNIIYIFLENLILYLRLNLGDGKDNIYGDISETKDKKKCHSEDISQKTDEENFNRRRKKVFSKTVINIGDSKSYDKSKLNYKLNNDSKSKLYKDNYLDSGKVNKEINLEKAFLKNLKKFRYLFKFKNIQFFNDFSFLSNKYIYTYESIFFDFLGQIYSFLYYVVPKFHGFEISFNQVNENRIKLTFQKGNSRIKTGYTHKKFQKKDTFILLGNKFKASNTVKTTEMTIEILNKLAKILDINLKIMDYVEPTEEKYLTILMPFYVGKEAKNNEEEIAKIHNMENYEYEHIEILDGNLIFVNSINHLDNTDESNNENAKIEDDIKNTTNKIIENINTKIINNNNLHHSSKKVSFQMNENELNSSNNCITNYKGNINSVNINININKNININNNFNTSSISSLISNNKNITYKSLNENCAQSPKNKSTNNLKEINNDKPKTKKEKNMLTLIHEKYSFLDRLKKSGVEILTEDLNTNDKIKENKYECKNLISEENHIKNNDKSSINVEADSENFFEIENDINNGIDDESSSEEIIFNNNYNNVNLQIGEDYWNIYNKNTNNINQNESLSNKNNIIKSQKEKINPILKQKKKYLVNKNNRYYNKTLSYSNSPKNILFVIPEIAENPNKRVVVPHPSCKLNNKYENEFNFAECGCNDILLVDDDEFICKTFKNILKKFKLQADTAENGQECLKMIKEKIEKNCKCEKSKYKIIFMDITMPVMDGIEAAKNIQKMIDKKEIYDSLKIIFVSAHANLDLSSTISGIKCAVDYYPKPISADMYKNVLNKYYYEKS